MFARERIGSASDIDAVETRIVQGLPRVWERVESPDGFASYVSKICKNALLSHRERRKVVVEADDATLGPSYDDERHATDGAVVRRDVARAVASLPAAVRVVAEALYVDRLSFAEVAEKTGHPLPTVRAYASKAKARFRESEILRAHHFSDVLPPGAVERGG